MSNVFVFFFFFVFSLRHVPLLPAFHLFLISRGSNIKGGVRIIPVDSGMGVEDWESKYKVPDSGVLDDYLDAEQKIWEDEDKSIIYRLSDSPYESKVSRFYQTVECDALSPEEPQATSPRQRHGFGSGEVRLVYKEAGSFEDESSPPEIDIIPSVKQLRQQTDREGLLYKTRLWAKTALEDTLESYAAFCEEEAAREEAALLRLRSEYGSVGSDEMQYSFGSDEELDDLTFTEGDAVYEYESYCHPGNYVSSTGGQGYLRRGRTSCGQDPMLPHVEEPRHEYVDAMDELKCLVHSVSEYLAVKEEEVNSYESVPKPIRRKLPTLPSEPKVVEPAGNSSSNEVKQEAKEDGAIEQGIAEVKHAMSSLFSTFTGSKSTNTTEASDKTPSPQPPQADSGISKLLSIIPKASSNATAASGTTTKDEPTSQAAPQPESGISKLLSFIPKSGGPSPPVAVVPPASQEPSTEKKFSLQSLIPFHSPDSSRQPEVDPTSGVTDTQGSAATANTSASGLESMLGRLSPLRLFSSAPPSREPSPQPSEQRSASATSNESQQGSNTATGSRRDGSETDQQSVEIRTGSGSGSVDLMSETGSGSVDLMQETGSGSVELFPETESSGELPDIQQRRATLSDPKPESSSDDTGFFSPFKKSLSTLISTSPTENPPQSDTKPAEESFLGSKLKIPFFSSDNVATTTPTKSEGGVLSGILKFASGEDINTAPKSPVSTPARSPSPGRAALLESVPKGNTETGWFSNLFKVTPSEPVKEPIKPQTTPTVTLTRPGGEIEHTEEMFTERTENTVCQTDHQTPSDIDHLRRDDVQPEQNSKPVDQTRTQPQASQAQGIFSGLLRPTEGASKTAQGGDGQPPQGGLLSSIFSSTSPTSTQTQENSAPQQPGGLFSGLLKFASDNVSAPSNQTEGQSGQRQGQPPTAQPPAGGLLSGLLKKATDTVIGSQPGQESQPDASDQTAKTKQPEPETSNQVTSSTQSAGILSGLSKLGSTETPTDKVQLDQQQTQSEGSNQELVQQQKQPDQTTKKLAPLDTQTTQSNEQSGSILSGLFTKIVDSTPSPLHSDPSLKSAQQTPSQQGGFLSGLFGIGGQDSVSPNPPNQQPSGPPGRQTNQQPGTRQNLQRQNQVPPQQPPSSPGGMLTGFFSKITEVGTQQQTVGSQPDQPQSQTTQQTSNQQGGFLSGLFSSGPAPSTQQQPPVGRPNQQQPNQGRQPLRRQTQIPPQPAASAPEAQQGGLLSGLFNKLTSDNAPQQPTAQTVSQQSNKSNIAGPGPTANQKASQPAEQGGFFSGLFSQTPPQQQQQPGKTASPQRAATDQPTQSGGLLSGILKLASGENAPQEQQPSKNTQVSQPGPNPTQPESGGIFSGLLNKISVNVEQSASPADQGKPKTTQQQQQQLRSGQGRPQIQRTKQVEVHSSQDGATDKDSTGSAQKGFLSGLFSVTEEASSSQPRKEEPKTQQNTTPAGLLSNVFKKGSSDSSTSAPGKETEKGLLERFLPKSKEDIIPSSTATLPTAVSTVDTPKEPPQPHIWQDPTLTPTQRYLEEIQRLLYGTADEYGYKDLLYNFTEHGVIPPELYEHQCLIEALLWQQLNDYALAEALATQVQERYQACQGHPTPAVKPPQLQNQTWLSPKEVDISGYNVPSHPWRDAAAQLFESRNRFLEPDEDVVLFDMSCRDRKPWSSCDHLNDIERSKKPWIVEGSGLNLSKENPKTRLNRCQSLTEFHKVEESNAGSYVKIEDFDLTLKSGAEFLKRLAKKRGPLDLTRGAVDLSRSAEDADEDIFFEDSEWYQQWISLLEQGLWWPAEAGDCGYYVYTNEDYIYSLLTDRAGKHLYACAAPEDVKALENITENIANILKQKDKDKITLCGFKIPLCSDQEGFWGPGQQQSQSVLLDAPMDLTSALIKGEKIMNMNLESFSQMFQESVSSQAERPVDFSMYKLKKIKVESVQDSYSCHEEPLEAADLTLKSLKGGHGGPYWKNQGLKDVLASTSSPALRCYSPQISPSRQIPEIRIAHADDIPSTSSSRSSTVGGSITTSPNSTTQKSDKVSSAAAVSSPKSGKFSETSKTSRTLPQVPSASKVPGPVQSERTLTRPPAVTKVPSSPQAQVISAQGAITTSPTTVVESVSPQRPRLARQPSQAEKPKVLSQANHATVTGMCEKVNSDQADQSSSPSLKTEKKTPQLHILNASPVTYNKPNVYRNHFGTTNDPQIGNKVIDFSSTSYKKENIQEDATTNANKRTSQKDKVVDFTKYKLKRFKEKKQVDTEVNAEFTDKPILAIDLTKQFEEEEIEWQPSECSTVDTSQERVSTVSMVSQTPLDQHRKPAGQLPIQQLSTGQTSAMQRLTPLRSAALSTDTKQTDVNCSAKTEKDSSPKTFNGSSNKVTISTDIDARPVTPTSSTSRTQISSQVSSQSDLEETSKTEWQDSIPVVKKHIESQGQQTNSVLNIQMQQHSPIVANGCKQQILVDHSRATSPNLAQRKLPQYQKTTAPANSAKAILDMSLKTPQPQQTVVQSKDPVSEALSLTKRKPVTSTQDADKSPRHQESIDLSFRELPGLLGQVSEHVQPTSFGRHHVKLVNLVEKDNTQRAQLPRQQSVLDESTESFESHRGFQQATAPANTVKLTLDMSSKSAKLKEAVPDVRTDYSEAIPLTRGKPSARELARKNSVGVPLVVDILSQEPDDLKISSPTKAQQGFERKRTLCHSMSQPSSTGQTYQTSSSINLTAVAALDMSPKPVQSTVDTKRSNDSILGEAIPLINNQKTKYFARKDSSGIPLVVEPKPQEFLCQKELHSVNQQQLPICKSVQRSNTVVTKSIIQPYLPCTAPANSVKGTIDMSTKTCTSDTVTYNLNPMSLVRPPHSQEDCVGMPLIVEALPSQEHPKRSQALVRSHGQVAGFVSKESQEVHQRTSAPANSIKGSLDMSPKPQLTRSETPPDMPAGVVPLIRKQSTVTSDGSAGVPLIVEQPAQQQGRVAWSGVKTTETLHMQISTCHSNQLFSNSKMGQQHTRQQYGPMDFSVKDNQKPATNIIKDSIEKEDGMPINFTNSQTKKEMFESKPTVKSMEKKTSLGIVDLTVESQNKTPIICDINAQDLSSPTVLAASQSSFYHCHQYVHAAILEEAGKDGAICQHRISSTTTRPGINCEGGTESNLLTINTSGSHSAPFQRKIMPPQNISPQVMQDNASIMFTPNITYQQINSGRETQTLDKMPPNICQLQTDPVLQQCQQPVVEVTQTPMDSFKYPPISYNLQRHDTSGMIPRPKILIKQPTMGGYGSTEDGSSESGTNMEKGKSVPSISSQQLSGKSHSVFSTQSVNNQSLPASVIQMDNSLSGVVQPMQSSTTTDNDAKRPPLQSEQPDPIQKGVTLHQTETCPSSTATYIPRVNAVVSQPTARPDVVPLIPVKRSSKEQGFVAENNQGQAIPSTPSGCTSVKGLISIFSGSQQSVSTKPPEVRPHQPHIMSTLPHDKSPVTQRGIPAVRIVAESPDIGTTSTSAISFKDCHVEETITPSIVKMLGVYSSTSPRPVELGSLPCTTTLVSDQKPQETLDSSQSQPVPAMLLKGIPNSSLIESSSEVTSKPLPKEPSAMKDHIAVSESDIPQQQNAEEIKLTTSPESVHIDTGHGGVLNIANMSQEITSPPRSIYIGINCPEPQIDTDINSSEPKPYVRLPHIFVSAASSPEEEKSEQKLEDLIKPEMPEVIDSEDMDVIAKVTADCKESLHFDRVAQQDVSEEAKAAEICSTEVNTLSNEILTQTTTDSTNEHGPHHILTKTDSTIEASVIDADVKPETTAACEPSTELLLKDKQSIVSEITPPEIIQLENTTSSPAPTESAGSPIEFINAEKSPTSDMPCKVESVDTLSLKEVPADVRSLEEDAHDRVKISPTSSFPELSPEHPKDEIQTCKEEIAVAKIDQAQNEQPNEQQDKGLFSMFNSSTATPQQTSSQSGISIFGGILPGSSSKDSPGTGLLSMFGGTNTQSSSGTKGPSAPLSTPQETQGKGLFSMFSGSNSQPQSGVRGPTAGSMPPKGPPPKDTPVKSLFSMFGGPAPQQQVSPRGTPATNTGSSLFGGILPGSTAQKESPSTGLFSKFGGPGAPQQTGPRVPSPGHTAGPKGPEPTGKGLFSMFSGTNQQAPTAQPAKPPESEGVFNVSSVFSLGGSSDGSKSKTGFGFFGKPPVDETKTETEITTSGKQKSALAHVKPPEINFSAQEKDPAVEAMQVSSPLSTSSAKGDPKGDQACNITQALNLDITISSSQNIDSLTDSKREVDKMSTTENVPSAENASVVDKLSVADTQKMPDNLQDKEAMQNQDSKVEMFEQLDIQEEVGKVKDTVDVDRGLAESEKDTEIKSKANEACSSDNIQMSESITDCSHKSTLSDMMAVEHVKPVAEEETRIPETVFTEITEPVNDVPEKQSLDAIMDDSAAAGEEESAGLMSCQSKEQLEKRHVEASNQEQTVGTAEPLKLVADEQAAVVVVGRSTDEVTLDAETTITHKPTMESLENTAITTVIKPETSTEEETNASSDKTVDEPIKETLEPEETSTEHPHGLHQSLESKTSVSVVADEEKSICPNQTSHEDVPQKGLSLEPASIPAQPLVRPGMTRPSGPAGQRMGSPRMDGPRMGVPRMDGPRMGVPRMAGPRMSGPRPPGPQKPPEPAPFSGFMSMFSNSNAPSKSSTAGGFFTSSPGSLFGSSPAPRQAQQPQQQQKSSFFGLSTSIAPESLTNDLFGIFKGSETTKPEEPQKSGAQSGLEDRSPEHPISENTEQTAPDKTSSAETHEKGIDDLEVPEKGLVEEAERTDKREEEGHSLIDSDKDAGHDAAAVHLEAKDSTVSNNAAPLPSDETTQTKATFEIPSLTAPKFGFLSGSAEGTSIGSLFSSTPSSAKAAQPQQMESGLFSGFKSLSAGIFQDDKPLGKEEPSSASSVFSMKLGSMFGNSDPPKPECPPPVVTAQPEPQSPKPTDVFSEKVSQGSGETGSADASDIEGLNETSKTGSCDTLTQSPQSELPLESVSIAESLDKPQLKVTHYEVNDSGVHTPDINTDLGREHPKDLLAQKDTKRPVQFVYLMVSLMCHDVNQFMLDTLSP